MQNRATVAGNIATASGAADLPTILLPLEARVVLESARGARELPLERFIAGYRQTERSADELIAEIVITVPAAGAYQRFSSAVRARR